MASSSQTLFEKGRRSLINQNIVQDDSGPVSGQDLNRKKIPENKSPTNLSTIYRPLKVLNSCFSSLDKSFRGYKHFVSTLSFKIIKNLLFGHLSWSQVLRIDTKTSLDLGALVLIVELLWWVRFNSLIYFFFIVSKQKLISFLDMSYKIVFI